MKAGRNILLWLLAFLVVGFLYLASSTDLIIKENEPEIVRISVIAAETDDDSYQNFRKGMEAAALDYYADVNFITLYEKDDWMQQETFIEREIADGCDGIILDPLDRLEASMVQTEKNTKVPFIFINDDVVIQDRSNGANFSFDFPAMGKELSQKLLEMDAEGINVFAGHKLYGASELWINALISEIPDLKINLFYPNGEEFTAEEMTQLLQTDGYPAVGLDLSSLHVMLDTLKNTSRLREDIPAVYALSSDASVLSGVRNRLFDGAFVTDGFAQGYLAVKELVMRCDHTNTSMESQILGNYYIEKEDLEAGTYDKILYPME